MSCTNLVNSSRFLPKAFGWFNFNSWVFLSGVLGINFHGGCHVWFLHFRFRGFGRSVDLSDRGLLCPRIAANKFFAGSDKTVAVWKLSSSVLVPGVRSIGSSESDAGSDC
jgi:hypothetical protein